MRWSNVFCLVVVLATATVIEAAEAKVLKVLPHRLDRQGRHTLSPSLFERDAYQAWLRQNPAECFGLRFDVSWKGPQSPGAKLKLRIEARTSKGDASQPLRLEVDAKPDRFGATWSRLPLDADTFKKVGEVTAWRASLWDGDRLLAEQKSFLW